MIVCNENSVRHADQLTVGRQLVLQIGAEAVEVLGTQRVDIRTAVREPADLVLAVIVKSHHDDDEMVASLFCLVKVEVAKCGLLHCMGRRRQWWSFNGAYWRVPGVCTTTVERPTGGRRGLGIMRDPCWWRIRGPCRSAGHDPVSAFFRYPPAAPCAACLSRGGQ